MRLQIGGSNGSVKKEWVRTLDQERAILAHTLSAVGFQDGRTRRGGVDGTVLVVEDVRRWHFGQGFGEGG